MTEHLGLLVDRDLDGNLRPEWESQHQLTINSYEQPPESFCAGATSDIPDEWWSPITAWHQGQTNSCAGHAEAAAFTHENWVQTGSQLQRDPSEVITFSPWYCYLTAQRAGGFFGRDGGTSITSTIKAATNDGACLEKLLPRPNHYNTNISETAREDAKQHHHLGELNVDLRDFDKAVAWLTDKRGIIIGTRWYSAQGGVRDVESLSLGKSGGFRGYHARFLTGWQKLGGIYCPRVLNSHGTNWGRQGRATIERELWEWWRKDANFFALGFGKIQERIPKRRDWSQFAWLGSGGSKSLV